MENISIRDELSTFEECCVQNYVANNGDQSKAFRECHETAHKWKATSVYSKASALFAQDKVRLRIKEVQDELKDKYAFDTDRLIREMAVLAFADRRELFDDSGNLKPLKDIDDDVAKVIAGIDVSSFGDSTTHKIKTYDKLGALDKLFKNKGLFEKHNAQKTTFREMTDEELQGIIDGAAKK